MFVLTFEYHPIFVYIYICAFFAFSPSQNENLAVYAMKFFCEHEQTADEHSSKGGLHSRYLASLISRFRLIARDSKANVNRLAQRDALFDLKVVVDTSI